MKNNFILFNQLTTSVYQLEIQSTTYTKRLINTILKWQWLYLLIINALIIKKTDDGSIFNISLIPFVFMLLIYLYFVIIGINETKPFLVKLKVDLYKRTFEINYLQYNTPITEVINLDNLKIRRISNGIGYNIFRGSWKMEFLLEKKRIFTQYSIDEQWSPEKFKQLASEIKLLKEMHITFPYLRFPMFPSTKNSAPFWYSKNVKVEEKLSYPFGSYPKPQISDLVVLAVPFSIRDILSSVSKGVYRYGFNGKVTDSETDLQDYGERIYNSAIAKFLSADPLIVKGKQYPWYSPYHFAGNTPISAIDLDGLEEFVMTNYTFKNSRGNTVIYKIDWIYINSKNRIINQPDGTGNYYFLEKNRTSPKPSGLAKHIGVFTKGWFNRNRDNIIENNKTDFSYSLVLDAKKRAVSDSKGNFSGSFLTLNSAVLHFDPDQGRTIDQVQSKFDLTSESFKEGFDNLAGLLIHDPNSIIHITGVANTTATNIGGEQSENTVNNNLILAQQRAEAGKSFLLEYIKEKYNIERLPDRIETNSKEGQSENKIVFKTVLND